MSFASRRLKKQGLEAFDNCKVKTVKVVDYGFPPYIDTTRGSFVNASDVSKNTQRRVISEGPTSMNGYMYGGSEAALECPYTQENELTIESEHDNHNGTDRAYDSLRKNAGLLACRSCQYSGMDPAEVAATRARLAVAEASRIEAEVASMQARVELERITKEIQSPQIRELPSAE